MTDLVHLNEINFLFYGLVLEIKKNSGIFYEFKYFFTIKCFWKFCFSSPRLLHFPLLQLPNEYVLQNFFAVSLTRSQEQLLTIQQTKN